MNYDWLNDDTDALIYIGDAMCSWCYGIAPELDQLKNNHPELDFKLLMGGLRPYNTEKAIDMADFLKSHWVEIEERTGQPFAFDILQNPEFIYDTEPPARACVVIRKMQPDLELDFFKDVQAAFYRDNKDTSTINTYLPIVAKYNLDMNEFERLFDSAEMKENVKADFQIVHKMGIKGFPSVVLKKDGEFNMVANGYQTAGKISEVIQRVIQKVEN